MVGWSFPGGDQLTGRGATARIEGPSCSGAAAGHASGSKGSWNQHRLPSDADPHRARWGTECVPRLDMCPGPARSPVTQQSPCIISKTAELMRLAPRSTVTILADSSFIFHGPSLPRGIRTI